MRELSLDCSCPDNAVPCKHLAATFYLLAESFDEDPFAIRPLADCLDRYFVPQAATRAPSPPVTSSTALLDQLPDITVTVRDQSLTELLRPTYLALGPSDKKSAAQMTRN